ncbi:MAG: hypothetical protein GXP09_03850 [Gammaproteobacteria bacterium]|nr:hypothetical protein [Gammaproteobacteria bacterium]
MLISTCLVVSCGQNDESVLKFGYYGIGLKSNFDMEVAKKILKNNGIDYYVFSGKDRTQYIAFPEGKLNKVERLFGMRPKDYKGLCFDDVQFRDKLVKKLAERDIPNIISGVFASQSICVYWSPKYDKNVAEIDQAYKEIRGKR